MVILNIFFYYKRPWANLEVGGLESLSVEGEMAEEHCFADDHPGTAENHRGGLDEDCVG